MPIVQVNTFICEICGAAESTTKVTNLYEIPIVVFPESSLSDFAWGYVSSSKKDDVFLACPKCNSNSAHAPL